MDDNYLMKLLKDFKDGVISIDEAVGELKKLPYEDLGFANLDHHRNSRNGFPEVIFCQGKTIAQIETIIEKLALRNDVVMATRAEPEIFEALRKVRNDLSYHPEARIIVVNEKAVTNRSEKTIAIISAGTSDIPVAEEAAVTAETMGNRVERYYDIGVAGIHRLLSKIEMIKNANVLVVVAGMEGALPSVVAGLVEKPVIAVPTSVGYGASFNGLAALLAMLNTCASGVGVVNIDNGFGAGYLASTINRL